jgi:hypothetical protein
LTSALLRMWLAWCCWAWGTSTNWASCTGERDKQTRVWSHEPPASCAPCITYTPPCIHT